MRRRLLRSTSLVLLSILAAGAMGAAPFQQDGGPDGIVSIEAEHFDNKVDKGTNTWSLVTTATGFTAPEGFSGGQAMQIMPDTPLGGRSVSTGFVDNSPRLDFQVNFVKTGTYYYWLLAFGRDGNSDSSHVGLDGKAFDTCDNLSGWNNNYRWRSTTMEGPRATFEVTEVGVHTLNVYMREDGLAFDKVLLTTNVDYTPTGHGPPESTRGIPDYATSPSPTDGATDILRDATLAWKPGPAAVTHDVYFGTVPADVTAASRTNPLNVLVSQGQDANTYDPVGRLEFGQTVYWRVDEVTAAPNSTIHKGNVWSFTAEPLVYRMQNIVATASSSNMGVGPQNTINGSGLTNDLHSTLETTMWVSDKAGPQPTWIQYEFDGVYKMHEMWVWNYNQSFESVLGFGFKDVMIEYSTNGTDWTLLREQQFAQATAQDGYDHNTTVDLGGVAARYVRLTARSNWSGLPQSGLSEVRFFYLPAHPREPKPAPGTTGTDIEVLLGWRAGREAASHRVYLSTDYAAVADGTALVDTIARNSYDPGPLELGKTYYWKVAEVNEAETPAVWEGDVWSFSTKESFVVDDFESYNDEEDQGTRIYETWIDGWVNNNGSTVGNWDPPFAEQTIIHGGKQSMPMDYNNIDSPFYSEVERSWDAAQDWTASGADTLTLYFRGNPIRFEEPAPGSITMSAGGADIWYAADEFRFATRRLTGNGAIVARVEGLGNTDPWAKAGVMIRESLDPGSRFAAVYATIGNGVRFQARLLPVSDATSDTPVATDEQKALQIPVWIKIERSGSSFSGFYSTDGVKWTAMSWNPQTINMAGSSVYIGLAVTSHNVNAMTTARFSGITATGGVSGSWEVATIGPAQPANDPERLYVTVKDSTGRTKTVSHPDPQATLLATWQEWRVPLSEFSSAGVNVAKVKTMSIGVGDRQSPVKAGTGKLYLDDITVGHRGVTDPGNGGLVAYYSLEGDVADGSGNGHDGTMVGSPVYVDGPAGYGKALHFDGTGSQYVTFGAWNPSRATGRLSVALWANWDGLNGQYQGLIAKRDSWLAGDMMWHLEAAQADGVIRVGREGLTQVQSEALAVGEWEPWAFTFDGSRVIIYRGGRQVGSGAFSFGTDPAASVQIGAGSVSAEGTGGNPYNGALDEIRLYDRALSPFEIRYLAGQE